MKTLSWGLLQTLCQKLWISKASKFTQAECDVVFRSPVWAFIIQRAAFRMSACFDAIGNPEMPEERVKIARLGIGNTLWVLQLENETRKFVEDDLVQKDMKVREIVCEAVRILSQIPISNQKDPLS